MKAAPGKAHASKIRVASESFTCLAERRNVAVRGAGAPREEGPLHPIDVKLHARRRREFVEHATDVAVSNLRDLLVLDSPQVLLEDEFDLVRPAVR